MRTVKPVRAAAEGDFVEEGPDEPESPEHLGYSEYDVPVKEIFEIIRVLCPDCAQPIALLADEERLPEHARCSSSWDPFRLSVCRGSGLSAHEAATLGEDGETQEGDLAALLTLPSSLDWRRQPFSHPSPAGESGGSSPRRRSRT